MSRIQASATLAILIVTVAVRPTVVRAQSGAPAIQTVRVNGVAMRVWASGLEQRKPGQPVVVLEAGAADPGTLPLDTWAPLLPALAAVTPVIAYERRGNGMSEADTEPPTMRRVAQVLHDLLGEARIAPPYVLVGHSWGGNYARAFTDQFPTEVRGLVFIDAYTGTEPTRAEKAAVLPPERRAAALAPPALPPIPANTSPGLRAEFQEIAKEMTNDGQEARAFKPVTGIPVGIVVATPPGRMRGDSGAVTRLIIQRSMELALSSPGGMFITASHVGHFVHRDDPALVVRLIQHVAGRPPAQR